MIFHRLTVENFGQFRERTVVDLRPAAGEAGLVLIGALNGSGKTTLVDAILLALYGNRAPCSTRGSSYPNFLREAIHRQAPKAADSAVELELELRAGGATDRVTVRRWWNHHRADRGDELQVRRGGQRDGAWEETWAERIEEALPLGLASLFIFDGERVKDLAAADRPTPAVREAIDTLFGLDLPARLVEDLGTVTKTVRARVARTDSNDQTTALTERVTEAQSLLTDKARLLEKQKRQVVAAQRAFEQADQNFVAQGGPRAQDRREREKERIRLEAAIEAQRGALSRALDGALLLSALEPDLAPLKEQLREQVTHMDEALFRRKSAQRDQRLLDALMTQSPDRRLIEQVKAALQRIDQQGAPASATWWPDPHGLMRKIEQATEQLPAARREAATCVAELEALEARRRGVLAALASVPSEDKVSALSEDRRKAEGALKQAQGLVEQAEREVEEARKALTRAKATLDLHQRNVALDLHNRKVDRRVMETADRVTEVLHRYRAALAARRKADLEHLIADRARRLLRKGALIDKVTLDPNTYAATLTDAAGDPIPRDRLSAGEQQLFAVALLWALGAATGRSLPVVIDTPLSRLDADHRQRLIEHYLPQASHQVIVLSTDTEIDEPAWRRLLAQGTVGRAWHLAWDPDKRASTLAPGYFPTFSPSKAD